MNVQEIREVTKHIMLVDDIEYIRYGANEWVRGEYYDIHYDESGIIPEFAKELEKQFQIYKDLL